MSERVRHAMLVVREASSFVSEIGTLRHERQATFDRVLTQVARAKNRSDLRNLCRRFLLLFDYKKLREKDLKKNIRQKY